MMSITRARGRTYVAGPKGKGTAPSEQTAPYPRTSETIRQEAEARQAGKDIAQKVIRDFAERLREGK